MWRGGPPGVRAGGHSFAAGFLVLAAGTASAQGLPDSYLGSAGDILPGSVTGSLPGYATGPLGSAAHTACNLGSVAGSAGAALPGELDAACQLAPALGNSGDMFLLGDYHGSVSELVGGVPTWAVPSSGWCPPGPPPTRSRGRCPSYPSAQTSVSSPWSRSCR